MCLLGSSLFGGESSDEQTSSACKTFPPSHISFVTQRYQTLGRSGHPRKDQHSQGQGGDTKEYGAENSDGPITARVRRTICTSRTSAAGEDASVIDYAQQCDCLWKLLLRGSERGL
jgi:hypothetical protein